MYIVHRLANSGMHGVGVWLDREHMSCADPAIIGDRRERRPLSRAARPCVRRSGHRDHIHSIPETRQQRLCHPENINQLSIHTICAYKTGKQKGNCKFLF